MEKDKLENQIILMGLNGMAYTPLWNKKVMELKRLNETSEVQER